MSRNPFNLLLRFLLEVAALVVMGRWAWGLLPGWAGALPGLGVPLVAAAAWGIFRVPNDGGPPVVPVPGPVRLLLEAVYFGAATWMALHTGDGSWGIRLGAAVALHYGLSMDRVALLVRNRPLPPAPGWSGTPGE